MLELRRQTFFQVEEARELGGWLRSQLSARRRRVLGRREVRRRGVSGLRAYRVLRRCRGSRADSGVHEVGADLAPADANRGIQEVRPDKALVFSGNAADFAEGSSV